MKEDFVTFEIAKKLKEKGYNGRTKGKHVEKVSGSEREEWDDAEMMYVIVTDVVTYPNAHIYDVLKWLREDKKIALNIEYTPRVWQFKVVDMSFNERFEPCGKTFYCCYEEAALAGIEYTLDNLI